MRWCAACPAQCNRCAGMEVHLLKPDAMKSGCADARQPPATFQISSLRQAETHTGLAVFAAACA